MCSTWEFYIEENTNARTHTQIILKEWMNTVMFTSTDACSRWGVSPKIAVQSLDVVTWVSQIAVLVVLAGTNLTAPTGVGHKADARGAGWCFFGTYTICWAGFHLEEKNQLYHQQTQSGSMWNFQFCKASVFLPNTSAHFHRYLRLLRWYRDKQLN